MLHRPALHSILNCNSDCFQTLFLANNTWLTVWNISQQSSSDWAVYLGLDTDHCQCDMYSGHPQDILNIRIRRFRYGSGIQNTNFTKCRFNVLHRKSFSYIRSSWGASFWSLCLTSPVTPCSLPTPPAPIFSPLFERQDKECKVTHFIGSVQCLLRYNELQLLLLLFSQLFVLFKLL